MRGHAAYEALAGAILLGEADAAQRREFALHAAACNACDPDVETVRTVVSSAMSAAMHGERWRPFVRDEVARRIDVQREGAGRRTTIALCAAVCATLALNVLLATRVGGVPQGRMPSYSWAAPSVAVRRPTPDHRARARGRMALRSSAAPPVSPGSKDGHGIPVMPVWSTSVGFDH